MVGLDRVDGCLMLEKSLAVRYLESVGVEKCPDLFFSRRPARYPPNWEDQIYAEIAAHGKSVWHIGVCGRKEDDWTHLPRFEMLEIVLTGALIERRDEIMTRCVETLTGHKVGEGRLKAVANLPPLAGYYTQENADTRTDIVIETDRGEVEVAGATNHNLDEADRLKRNGRPAVHSFRSADIGIGIERAQTARRFLESGKLPHIDFSGLQEVERIDDLMEIMREVSTGKGLEDFPFGVEWPVATDIFAGYYNTGSIIALAGLGGLVVVSPCVDPLSGRRAVTELYCRARPRSGAVYRLRRAAGRLAAQRWGVELYHAFNVGATTPHYTEGEIAFRMQAHGFEETSRVWTKEIPA